MERSLVKSDRNQPLHLSDSGAFGRLQVSDHALEPSRGTLQARLSRLWLPATVVLVALGPIVGFVAWQMASNTRHEEVQGRFQDNVTRRTQVLSEQVLSFSELLHACEGLFDASENVTRDEFALFTSRARDRHPEIHCLGWAPRVPARDLAAHEAQARAEGFERYGVTRGEGTAAAADEHYPLLYVEPLEPQRVSLGQDLLADPFIGPTLRHATTLQHPLISDPLPPAYPGGELPAVAVLGVRKRGELVGVVLLRFSYQDIASRMAARLLEGDGPLEMHLLLYDVDVGGESKLLAQSGPARAAPADSGISARHRFNVAGQTWMLSAVPSARFLDREFGSEPLLIGVVAFLLWELFSGCLLGLSRAFHRNTIRQQGRAIGRVMQSLAEGVVVIGRDGRVRLANHAARELIGAQADDVNQQEFNRRVVFMDARALTPLPADEAPLERATRGEIVEPEDCLAVTPARPGGVWVSVSGRPLRDEWGDLLGGVLVVQDVTERHRSERELREKETLLQHRKVEMELAADVQRRLYPRRAPTFPGLDVAGAVDPAEETCGDYFDYVPLPDGSLLLAIGDVSGHGLGPALVMAETRAYVRSLAKAGEPPRSILKHINDAFCADLGDDQFVTMALVSIASDGRTITYASAGHTPVLHIDADGELKASLGFTGPPLGMFGDRDYTQENGYTLAAGDILVLMTDGATEAPAPDGRMFEERGVLEVVRAHRGESAEAIVQWVDAALHNFAGEALGRDDVTLVVCKREPVAQAVIV